MNLLIPLPTPSFQLTGIRVCSCDGHEKHVLVANVEKRVAVNVLHGGGRTGLLGGDHLHKKRWVSQKDDRPLKSVPQPSLKLAFSVVVGTRY